MAHPWELSAGEGAAVLDLGVASDVAEVGDDGGDADGSWEWTVPRREAGFLRDGGGGVSRVVSMLGVGLLACPVMMHVDPRIDWFCAVSNGTLSSVVFLIFVAQTLRKLRDACCGNGGGTQEEAGWYDRILFGDGMWACLLLYFSSAVASQCDSYCYLKSVKAPRARILSMVYSFFFLIELAVNAEFAHRLIGLGHDRVILDVAERCGVGKDQALRWRARSTRVSLAGLVATTVVFSAWGCVVMNPVYHASLVVFYILPLIFGAVLQLFLGLHLCCLWLWANFICHRAGMILAGTIRSGAGVSAAERELIKLLMDMRGVSSFWSVNNSVRFAATMLGACLSFALWIDVWYDEQAAAPVGLDVANKGGLNQFAAIRINAIAALLGLVKVPMALATVFAPGAVNDRLFGALLMRLAERVGGIRVGRAGSTAFSSGGAGRAREDEGVAVTHFMQRISTMERAGFGMSFAGVNVSMKLAISVASAAGSLLYFTYVIEDRTGPLHNSTVSL